MPAVEGRGVDMDEDAALAVDLATGAVDGPDLLLQLLDVVIAPSTGLTTSARIRTSSGVLVISAL